MNDRFRKCATLRTTKIDDLITLPNNSITVPFIKCSGSTFYEPIYRISFCWETDSINEHEIEFDVKDIDDEVRKG